METWGEFGSRILKTFHRLLIEILDNSDTPCVEKWETPGITFFATPSSIFITAICLQKEWDDLLQCLAWINEVLGCPTSNRHPCLYRRSDVEQLPLSANDTHLFKTEIGELETLITLQAKWIQGKWDVKTALEIVAMEHIRHETGVIEDEQSANCWMHLIEQSYAGNYQLPLEIVPRNIGKGLRVRFDILCILADIERVIVDDDGGIILTGYCTALVPIEVIDERYKSIQCHFIVQKSSGNRFRSIHNRPDFWDLIPKQRMHETSLDNFRGIAYVGWCENIEFKIGTLVNTLSLGYTSLTSTKHRWELRERGLALALQFGLPSSAGISSEAQLTQRRSIAFCPWPSSP